MDFTQFNKKMDEKQLREKIEEEKKSNQAANVVVPAGEYTCIVDKLELGATKDGRPMLKAQFRITEGQYKKHCVFMNRVCAGTKNDMKMIASVEGWVNSLDPETPLSFNGNYNDFASSIMDIAEELCGKVYYKIDYNSEQFNSISIKECWDK